MYPRSETSEHESEFIEDVSETSLSDLELELPDVDDGLELTDDDFARLEASPPPPISRSILRAAAATLPPSAHPRPTRILRASTILPGPPPIDADDSSTFTMAPPPHKPRW